MPAFTSQVENSYGIFACMHHFSFVARMCFVAWNDNMEVASNCCYVSLAANSCIPGLKVLKSMKLFSFSKKQDIVEMNHWYVVFQGGLESFNNFLFVP